MGRFISCSFAANKLRIGFKRHLTVSLFNGPVFNILCSLAIATVKKTRG